MKKCLVKVFLGNLELNKNLKWISVRGNMSMKVNNCGGVEKEKSFKLSEKLK